MGKLEFISLFVQQVRTYAQIYAWKLDNAKLILAIAYVKPRISFYFS